MPKIFPWSSFLFPVIYWLPPYYYSLLTMHPLYWRCAFLFFSFLISLENGVFSECLCYFMCVSIKILHCRSGYCVLSVPQLSTQVCTTGLLWLVSCNALCISHHFRCVPCIYALLTFTCMSCTRLHFDVDAHTHKPGAVRCRTLRLMFAVPRLRT